MTLLIKNGGYVFLIRLYLMLSMSLGKEFQSRKHSSGWRRLEDVLKTSSRRFQDILLRRFQDIFKTSLRRLAKTSSRHFPDVFKIETNIFTLLIRLQNTSSRRLDQDQYIPLGHTFSRHFQDIFKTSSRHLQDILLRPFQDVFKTSSRRLLVKTSSRHLAKMSSRPVQDVSY